MWMIQQVRTAEARSSSTPFESAISAIPTDLDWQDQALCAQVDPGIFFPEKGDSAAPAKAVCALCPVRTECLQYALDHDERFAVWGGMSERERRALKQAERKVAA